MTSTAPATAVATEPHPWVQAAWVRFPRWLSRRAAFLGGLAADGHPLAALGRVVLALDLLALVGGLWVGWQHPGGFVTIAETTGLIMTMIVIGALSSRFAVLFFAGFVFGDFFLFRTEWSTSFPGYGIDQPIVENVLYVRVPVLIHYLVIAAVLIGMPAMVRALVQSIALYIPPIRYVDTMLAAVACAVVAYVLTTLWAGTAPIAVLPMFRWGPTGGALIGEIQPVWLEARTLSWVAAGAMIGRFALFALVPLLTSFRQRLAGLEHRLLAPQDPPRPASLAQRTVLSAVGALTGAAYLGGILASWRAFFLVYTTLFLSLLARYRVIPFPPRAWREFMDRIPALARFIGGVALVAGIGRATLATNSNQLQDLAVSAIAAALILLALMPGEPRDEPLPSDPERGRMGPGTAFVILCLSLVVASVLFADPAAADDCSDLNDCWALIQDANIVFWSLIFIFGLGVYTGSDTIKTPWMRRGFERFISGTVDAVEFAESPTGRRIIHDVVALVPGASEVVLLHELRTEKEWLTGRPLTDFERGLGGTLMTLAHLAMIRKFMAAARRMPRGPIRRPQMLFQKSFRGAPRGKPPVPPIAAQIEAHGPVKINPYIWAPGDRCPDPERSLAASSLLFKGPRGPGTDQMCTQFVRAVERQHMGKPPLGIKPVYMQGEPPIPGGVPHPGNKEFMREGVEVARGNGVHDPQIVVVDSKQELIEFLEDMEPGQNARLGMQRGATAERAEGGHVAFIRKYEDGRVLVMDAVHQGDQLIPQRCDLTTFERGDIVVTGWTP